jgi:hypothetical protein
MQFLNCTEETGEREEVGIPSGDHELGMLAFLPLL